MENILYDPDRLSRFTQFLVEQMAAENVEFWVQADAYRKLDTDIQKTEAVAIYKKFIRHNSSSAVNIPGQISVKISNDIVMGNITPDMFSDAVTEVKTMLLPRYHQFEQRTIQTA